jgi:hypothetical protein
VIPGARFSGTSGARFSGTHNSSNQGVIHVVTNTDSIVIDGGSAANAGANIVLFGGAHATAAYDVLFQAGTDDLLRWDESADLWIFYKSIQVGYYTYPHNLSLELITESGYDTTLTMGEESSSYGFRWVYEGSDDNHLHLYAHNATYPSGNEVLWLDRGTFYTHVRYYLYVNEQAGTCASSGSIRLPNNSTIQFRNAADSGNVEGIGVNTADQLRLGGVVLLDSSRRFFASTSTVSMRFAGGSTFQSGGNMMLYGESHASYANDIVFLAGTTELLRWDDSDDRWECFKRLQLAEALYVYSGSTTSEVPLLYLGKSDSPSAASMQWYVASSPGENLYWYKDDGSTATRYFVISNSAVVVETNFGVGTYLSTYAFLVTYGGGVQVGAPTGGDRGAGSINVAADIYKNDTAYTNPDYVFELHFRGSAPGYCRRGYEGLMPLRDVERFTRSNCHLPGIKRGASGLFERADMVLEKIEEIYLYLFDHQEKIDEILSVIRN